MGAKGDWEYCYIHLARGQNGHGIRVLVVYPEDSESNLEYSSIDLAKAEAALLSDGWVSVNPTKEVLDFASAGILSDLANYYFYRRARRRIE